MNQLIEKTLSEIVTEQFHAASIFEKYHLDYCCKGKRSLQKACEEQNVPVSKVVNELESVFAHTTHLPDFNAITLFELTEYIILTHHSYVKKEMPQIISFLQKVTLKHGNKHPELYQVSEKFAAVAEEMTSHMYKEETVLFPRIKEVEKSSFEPLQVDSKIPTFLKLPIINMEHEHEDVGKKMEEIRKLTNNYASPADACTTYKLMYACLHAFEIDLHHHVHLENSILFPKALALENEIKIRANN